MIMTSWLRQLSVVCRGVSRLCHISTYSARPTFRLLSTTEVAAATTTSTPIETVISEEATKTKVRRSKKATKPQLQWSELLLCPINSKTSVREQFLDFQMDLVRKSLQADSPHASTKFRLLNILNLIEKPEEVDLVVEILEALQFYEVIHSPSIAGPIFDTFERIGAHEKCLEVFCNRQKYRLTPNKRVVEGLLIHAIKLQDGDKFEGVINLLKNFNWFPSWKVVSLLVDEFPSVAVEILSTTLKSPPPIPISDDFLEKAISMCVQLKRADLAQYAWTSAEEAAKTPTATSYYAVSRLLHGDLTNAASLIKQSVSIESIDKLVQDCSQRWSESDPELIAKLQKDAQQLKQTI